MKIGFFSFSAKGKQLVELISKKFESENCECEKYNKCAFVGSAFSSCELLIFVCATGIAVRGIAPFVCDKTKDPAVVCLDDGGNFVISLLSGHIGGGNDFARKIANFVGGTAVITTATDVAGKFACDSWAVKNGCEISSMKMAKRVSAEILNRNLPLVSDFEISGKAGGITLLERNAKVNKEENKIGIYVGYKNNEPFENTLALTPKCLAVGIGCRRGVSLERIKSAVLRVFADNNLNISAIEGIYSIDVKADEDGILEFAKEMRVSPIFYSKDQLESVAGEFESSEFVKSVVGVSNVCERASLCEKQGELIVKKTPCGGVTVAVALLDKKFSLGGENGKS